MTCRINMKESYITWRPKILSLMKEFWNLYEIQASLEVLFSNSCYCVMYTQKNNLITIEDN